MEMILTILVFAVFAILADKFDAKKKQRKLPMPAPTRKESETSLKKPKPAFEIPEIKSPTEEKKEMYKEPQAVMIEESTAEINKYQKFLAEKAQRIKAEHAAYDKEQEKLRAEQNMVPPPVDLHANAILNAIAYEQILGRPKAWRQLRNRWQNFDQR
jgi:hypothetical protein